MAGVEIDMVVTNSIEALSLYEHVFDTERIEATNYKKGLNEAIFTMYGVRFHLFRSVMYGCSTKCTVKSASRNETRCLRKDEMRSSK